MADKLFAIVIFCSAVFAGLMLVSYFARIGIIELLAILAEISALMIVAALVVGLLSWSLSTLTGGRL